MKYIVKNYGDRILFARLCTFWWDDDRFVIDHNARWIFIVFVHWHDNPRVDMSLHSDTIFLFRDNQSLLLPFSAVCLVEKQQLSIS
jgi:hypothetical protein